MKRTRLLFINLVVACAHFAASWVVFMKSARIKTYPDTALWQTLTEILCFPLGYVLDSTPLFMIGNALLWAWVLASGASFVVKRMQVSISN